MVGPARDAGNNRRMGSGVEGGVPGGGLSRHGRDRGGRRTRFYDHIRIWVRLRSLNHLYIKDPESGETIRVDSHNKLGDDRAGTLFVIDACILDEDKEWLWWSHSLGGGQWFGTIPGHCFLGHSEEGSELLEIRHPSDSKSQRMPTSATSKISSSFAS